MYLYRRNLLFVVIACLWFTSGCSFKPVNSSSVFNDPGVRRIDPNNGPFEVMIIEHKPADSNESKVIHTFKWKTTKVTGSMNRERTFCAKYRDFDFSFFSHPVIDVEMPGGFKCAALLDTGYSGTVYVNDLVVRQSNLAVFPLGQHSETGCQQGYCEIPFMKIGPVTIENPVCWYEQRHWRLKVIGIPLYKRKLMLLGLDALSQFSYVMFDNVNRRAVFSLKDGFEPNDSSQWISHPFVIRDINNQKRMMTDISLGSNVVHVEFDTGGAKPELILRDDVWRRIADSIEARGGSKALHPSFQFGWHWCRRYTLPQLQFGPMTLQDTKVDIMPADSLFAQDFEGILSLDCMKDTAVVLDFTRNLIWVRKF